MQDVTYMPKTDVAISEKIDIIANVLVRLNQQIISLQAQIADLDQAGICTASAIYWRDKNSDHPRMYANHGVGVSCPLHGAPKPGKRLRVYVRADQHTSCEAAIERCEQKEKIERRVRLVEMRRASVERAVTAAWRVATGDQRWEW